MSAFGLNPLSFLKTKRENVSVKVKICGVRTPAIIAAAAEAGADYVGLVFFPRSLRYVSPEDAERLAEAARGHIKTVAVLVDPEDALVDRVLERVRPDILQLHGGESPARAASIKARSGLPILKAIAVAEAGDTDAATPFQDIADMILFDAKADIAATVPGGNGVAFDWRALMALASKQPFALSGGLHPGNVGAALSQTGAAMVDVSSGVEKAPGEKDAALVRKFVELAKGACRQSEATVR